VLGLVGESRRRQEHGRPRGRRQPSRGVSGDRRGAPLRREIWSARCETRRALLWGSDRSSQQEPLTALNPLMTIGLSSASISPVSASRGEAAGEHERRLRSVRLRENRTPGGPVFAFSVWRHVPARADSPWPSRAARPSSSPTSRPQPRRLDSGPRGRDSRASGDHGTALVSSPTISGRRPRHATRSWFSRPARWWSTARPRPHGGARHYTRSLKASNRR
jgi:hypothetical protein